jgi:hypothetical protein
MAVLRHPAPVLRFCRQPIALNDRHAGIVRGQHVYGQQAGDAPAKDNRVITH